MASSLATTTMSPVVVVTSAASTIAAVTWLLISFQANAVPMAQDTALPPNDADRPWAATIAVIIASSSAVNEYAAGDDRRMVLAVNEG